MPLRERFAAMMLRDRTLWIVFVLTLAVYAGGLWHPVGSVMDEGVYRGAATRLLRGDPMRDGIPLNNEHPPFVKQATALSIFLLGNHPFAVRLPEALAASSLCCAMYLIGVRLFSSRAVGLLAALLLLLDNVVYLGAQTIVLDTVATAFALGSIALALRAPREAWTVPVLLGLAVASKLTAAFVAPLVFFLWLRARAPKRGWSDGARGIGFGLALAATFLFAHLPFIVDWGRRFGWMTVPGWLWTAWVDAESRHVGVGGRAFGINWAPLGWFDSPEPLRAYRRIAPNGDVAVIFDVGNPIIWWLGLAVLIGGLFIVVAGRVSERPFSWTGAMNWNGFLVASAGFVLQWAPYLFMARRLFAYYMIGVAPYLALLAAAALAPGLGLRKGRILVTAFLLLAAGAFMLRLPFVEALWVSPEYMRALIPGVTVPLR